MAGLRRGALFGIEEALDDAVLQRMERHHREPPAFGEQALGREQAFDQFAQFIVHRDAQRLEAAGRRMGIARLPADGLFDRRGEHRRRGDGLVGARRDDEVRDAPGFAFLAIGIEQIGEIFLFEAIDEVRRAVAVTTHPHVERTVAHEGKAAQRLVELHGGDADVEHHAIDRGGAGELIEGREAARYEAEALGKLGGQRLGERRHIGVAIDRHDRGARLEQGPRIATRPEGAVDKAGAGERRQRLEHLGEEHRGMPYSRRQTLRHFWLAHGRRNSTSATAETHGPRLLRALAHFDQRSLTICCP